MQSTENPRSEESKKEHKIDWHPAMFQALQAELFDYLPRLQFLQEFPLNKQPLRIDAIVVKAEPGLKIKKAFAEDFRGHNIVEFKSPKDSLGMSEYLKTVGYAYLYQSVEKVNYTDMTLDFLHN